MRVAIIGAGVSGLSCAYELERNSIRPVIFEKRSHVGEGPGYTGFLSRQFNRPSCDALAYVRENYHIILEPLSEVREINLYSPGRKLTARGNHGYFFKRGVENYSLENQIASGFKPDIKFDSYIKSIDEVKNDFTHVVVSSGSSIFSKEMGIWKETFSAQARIAIILGNFKRHTCFIWFDTEYANNSYAYLIPTSTKEASLVLIVNNITPNEMDYHWERFIQKENIGATIIELRDTEHNTGSLEKCQVNNIYFTGNAGGLTDNLIGFGAFNAVESGVLAARAIVGNLDYNKLIQPIRDDIEKLHQVRLAMNTLDNSGFDKLLDILKTPGIKHIVYKNTLYKFKYAAPLANLYMKISKIPRGSGAK